MSKELKDFSVDGLMQRLNQDVENFTIKENNESYLLSYPHFVKYFEDISVDNIDIHHLTIGIHFVYGWMPTIFGFKNKQNDPNLERVLSILNKAKFEDANLTEEEYEILKKRLNNSMVGVSKLLHFINPERFSIWDSKVYYYRYSQKPYYYRVEDIETYINYLKSLRHITETDKGITICNNVRLKLHNQGFDNNISNLRALEVLMFAKSAEILNH